jgi:hypothetical protein
MLEDGSLMKMIMTLSFDKHMFSHPSMHDKSIHAFHRNFCLKLKPDDAEMKLITFPRKTEGGQKLIGGRKKPL